MGGRPGSRRIQKGTIPCGPPGNHWLCRRNAMKTFAAALLRWHERYYDSVREWELVGKESRKDRVGEGQE